ncbi:helix-turn-helix domain-containing protein [Microbulbifer sp. OS29]|uniref:Helix-turn-helix domain-containing protein n=1 Tax=Microbulbifer okhotskensis TaxID=2926617 RepID=A0A9X2ERM9_9GAMM|nr:helix-turn-helix transcriptional regulator [Microbulbifer okhotskensis]MCO1336535.1 helix-turn-helix domain-containing protein [Microbulbifer okhotskensis]
MSEAETLGDRLRNARKKEGKTIAQLATQLGLAPSQISKMETGSQKVPAELLSAWCEAVGITLAEVYGAENLHHFAQIPFPPLIARLYAQLPKEFRRHIHRVIESSYQLWKSRR